MDRRTAREGRPSIHAGADRGACHELRAPRGDTAVRWADRLASGKEQDMQQDLERIDVLDYKTFGEMVVGWSLDPSTRPADIDALRAKTQDVLKIPARVTRLTFVEVGDDALVVRVPNPTMVRASVDRFSAPG